LARTEVAHRPSLGSCERFLKVPSTARGFAPSVGMAQAIRCGGVSGLVSRPRVAAALHGERRTAFLARSSADGGPAARRHRKRSGRL